MTTDKLRPLRIAGLTLCLLLTACGSLEKSDKKVDYRGASSTSPLEIPPDLTAIGSQSGSNNTLSSLNQQINSKAQVVLPEIKGITLEHDGSERWLEIEESPEIVWEKLRQFWFQESIELEIDKPAAGIMETQWIENMAQYQTRTERAFRSFVGASITAGVKDKYRIRLERSESGGATELYLTHRGLERTAIPGEVPKEHQDSVWVPAPANTELEAEMLRLIMIHLGLESDRAAAIAGSVSADQAPERATILRDADDQPYLELPDNFSRAWRRVGLALDRIGFTVEDRDRQQGVYYVRSFDPEDLKKKSGLFRRWFGEKKETEATQTEVSVSSEGTVSLVTVNTDAEAGSQDEIITRMVELLHEQLR